MRIIEAVNDCTLKIGKTGENDATVVVFNLQDWLTLFGNNGTFQLMFKRPTDEHAYPVVIETTEGVVNWTVDETALAYSGVGLCEVIYLVDNTIAKSQTWICEIEESPSDNSEEPPAPWQGWVDDVLQAATDAENAAENADAAADRAEEAAVHAPQIGENGNWEVWNQERGEYVDTGVPARSSSIHNDLEERNAEDAHPAASVSYFQGYEENEPDKKTNLDLALKYFSEGYGSEIVPLRTGWVRVACLMRAMNGRFGVSLTYNKWNKGRFTQNLMLEYSATARYAKKAYPSTGTPIENIGQPIVWQVSNVICGENPFCDRADDYKSRFNIIDAVRIVGISDESDTPNKMISFIDVHITNRGNTSDGFSLAEFGAQLKLNLAGKSWNNSVVPIYEYIDVSDINVPYTYVNNHETYREVMQEQARINVDFNHQVNLHPLVSAFIHQLTLGLAPTDDMDAATKKYVDDGLATKVGMDNHGNIPLVNLGNVPKVEVSYTDPQTGDDGTQMTIEAAVQLAVQIAHSLTNKVDKVSGKGLSTNDFTNALKTKVNNALQPSEKGVSGGVASLGGDGKVPAGQLPLSDVVAIGPSEQEESIVDENGVAHVPMVVSKTSEKRPGMVRTWSERYASAATDAGVLVAQPKTISQFYEQRDGEDVVHENAFVAKGTLQNLMGNPQGAALIATKDELAASKMQHITTLTAAEATNLLAVDLTTPLREVFCYISAIGGTNSTGNVALRMKNGNTTAGRTIGTLTVGTAKAGIAKFAAYFPDIKIMEKTTLTADTGVSKASDYYVFPGGMPDGAVTRIELAASSSGNTFAAGTKLVICGVRA